MSSPSPGPDRSARIAVIGCGALTIDIERAAQALGQDVDFYPLPPLLHNHPERIAPAVAGLIEELRPRYADIAIGYADCGTYGALDELCAEHGLRRLAGDHCYDAYAGRERIAALMAEHPGTYLLTDFLIAGFDRLVWRELGLDRHPELLADYFGNYEQVAWLAVHRTADLERAAGRVAERLGLPLLIIDCAAADGARAPFEAALAAAIRQQQLPKELRDRLGIRPGRFAGVDLAGDPLQERAADGAREDA